MNPSAFQSNPTGPDGLVEALIETLQEEEAELTRLAVHFGRQLEALRDQEPLNQHEQAMDEATETVGMLGQLRARRERQMRLLGRVLKVGSDEVTLQQLAATVDRHPGIEPWGTPLLEARAAVRRQAETTRHVCEQLDFALQYAVSLGREMLKAMQDLDRPPPPCVYTATGHTSHAAAPRSFVNKVG